MFETTSFIKGNRQAKVLMDFMNDNKLRIENLRKVNLFYVWPCLLTLSLMTPDLIDVLKQVCTCAKGDAKCNKLKQAPRRDSDQEYPVTLMRSVKANQLLFFFLPNHWLKRAHLQVNWLHSQPNGPIRMSFCHFDKIKAFPGSNHYFIPWAIMYTITSINSVTAAVCI